MFRIRQYDFMRGIGLLCIILAHVNAPNYINFVRSFDVPLLILIAGAMLGLKDQINFTDYFKKRVLRLLVPTYIFLCFFFLFFLGVSIITRTPYFFSVTQIIESFALLKGIGYVWIIRVFILVAFAGYFLVKLHNKTCSIYKYMGCLVLFYGIYEFSFFVTPMINNNIASSIVAYYIHYLIPYGVIFGLGIILPNIKTKYLYVITLMCLILFIVCGVINGFNLISTYKYPPRLYYLSYGLGISILIFICTRSESFLGHGILTSKISYLGQSSLWIYLWHIFVIILWSEGISHIPSWANHFVVKFVVVILLSTGITAAQKYFISRFIDYLADDNGARNPLSFIFLK